MLARPVTVVFTSWRRQKRNPDGHHPGVPGRGSGCRGDIRHPAPEGGISGQTGPETRASFPRDAAVRDTGRRRTTC